MSATAETAVAGTAPDGPARGAAGAGLWTVGGRLAARLVDVLTLLVLVRLLPPADFGLVALGTTILQTVEAVLELPLAQALIRMPAPGGAMFATALTLGALRGAAVAVLMTALAWPAALFFGEPRLVPLILAMAIAPVCRGLVSPRMVVFMRRMDFRREAALDVGGKLTAFAVAVPVALATGSYWAIAAGTIAAPVAAAALSYGFAPMRPRLTLAGWPHFADMLGWNSLAQLVAAANWQADRIVLGRFVPPSLFGRFTISDTLAALPFQALVEPLTRPLLVSFSTVRRRGELGPAYLAAAGVVTLLLSPVYAFLVLFADPVVTLVLGAKWQGAGPVLAAIASIVFLQFPTHPSPSFLMSQDRTRLLAARNAVELLVRLPAGICGAALFGIPGAILARALGAAATLVFTAAILRRGFGLSPRTFAAHVARHYLPVAAAAAIVLATFKGRFPADTIPAAAVTVVGGGVLLLAAHAASVALVARFAGPDSPEARIVGFAGALLARVRPRRGHR